MALPATKYPNNSRQVIGPTVRVYDDDVILLCDTSKGAIEILLPEVVPGYWNTLYKLYIFDNENDAGANNITITPPSGYKVNNQSSLVLNSNGQGVVLVIGDNTNWVVSASTNNNGGHIIEDEGVILPQQPKLNFIGMGVVVTNNIATNSTDVTIAGGSIGITSLNGLTAQIQTFAIGVSGADFNIVSTGSVHTYNLPIASAVNTGKLSNTDWSIFNNKIGGAGTVNVIPKFISTSTIGDGSWEFPPATNTLRPVNTGSDIGDINHRVSTIYMSSTINYAAGSSMIFSENGTEKMRILTGGNVGIGTSNPESPLQVVSSSNECIRLSTLAVTDRLKMFLGDGTGALDGDFYIVGNNNYFHFGSTTQSSAVNIYPPLQSVGIFASTVSSNVVIIGKRTSIVAPNSALNITSSDATNSQLNFATNNSGATRASLFLNNSTQEIGLSCVNNDIIYYGGSLGTIETIRMTNAGDLVFKARGQGINFAGSDCRIERPIGSDTVQISGADITLNSSHPLTGVVVNTNHVFSIYNLAQSALLFIANPNTSVIGIKQSTPTAYLHLGAGTTTATTAPLKFTAGALLFALELGAMEFIDDGTDGHLYITKNIAGVLTRTLIV